MINVILKISIITYIILVSAKSFANNSNFLNIPLTTQMTWKEKRDYRVSKQDVDYSCGASSLSTILNEFYQFPKTEQEILEDMQLKDIMSSFQDLSNISEKYGFSGRGIFTNYESLSKIKIPVIVYLNHKRNDHFSVIRTISETHVYLADSSWGNRILTKQQFEKMWYINEQQQGKVLLILPKTEQQKKLTDETFIKITETNKFLREPSNLLKIFL